MFDVGGVMIGGIQVIAIVFGLTEFLKNLLNLDGKKVTALAALLGAVLMGLYQLIGIAPEPYSQVLNILFLSVAFGLSASGYYKFIDKRAPSASYSNRVK